MRENDNKYLKENDSPKLNRMFLLKYLNIMNEMIDLNFHYEYNYYHHTTKDLNLKSRITKIGDFKINTKKLTNVTCSVYLDDLEKNKDYISCTMIDLNEKGFNISYSIGNENEVYQYEKTDYQTLVNITNTVYCIIKEFINRNNDRSFYTVMGYNKNRQANEYATDLHDHQKYALYEYLLCKWLPSDYKIRTGKILNQPVLIFQKKTDLEIKRYNKKLENRNKIVKENLNEKYISS